MLISRAMGRLWEVLGEPESGAFEARLDRLGSCQNTKFCEMTMRDRNEARSSTVSTRGG